MNIRASVMVVGFLLPLGVYAQNITDAVRVGRIDYQGTARFGAMGGAMGALGGDISTSMTNPAGLGVVRRSEFSFSPSLFLNYANANYNGNDSRDQRAHFTLGNLGFMNHQATGNPSGVLGFTWGLGYNRLTSFYRDYTIFGANPGSSLADVFAYDLNGEGVPVNPNIINELPQFAFGPALGWNTFVVDFDSVNQEYFQANPGYEGNQQKTVQTEGSMDEFSLFIGSNFNNRFYLGGSLLITNVRYRYESQYEETLPDSAQFTALTDYQFNESLRINGLGFQLKLGAIYRVNDFVRIGLAYHSPTRINLEDQFENSVTSSFRNGFGGFDLYESVSPAGTYTYTIRRPGRWILSSGFVFGKQGLLGIDYEVVDNARTEITNGQDGYDFAFENGVIKDQLAISHHLRIGTEYRLKPFAIRAGFRYDGSPYGSDHSIIEPIYTWSLGGGFRNARYIADLTWKWASLGEQVWMYDPAFVPSSQITGNEHHIVLTLGLRW